MPGSMLPNSRSSFRSVPAVGNTSMGMAQPDTHQTIVAPSENAIIPTESVNNINFSGGGAGTSIAGNPMYSEGNPARLGTLSAGDPVSPFRTGNPMASFPSETMRQEILLREQNPNVYQEMQPLGGSSIPAQDSVMPQAAYTMQAPSGNYGLSGAEQALQSALGAQAGALTQGAHDAFGTMQRGSEQARSDISGGLSTGLRLAQQGLSNARGDINEQLNSGLSALRGDLSTGRGDITQASEGAIDRFNPYEQTGRTALDKEAAFSGALGPEAQAQAFADYQASPGQQWLQQQQEQSLLRNAAATGGTQSGNVLSALQEQAAGRAAQNYQQDLGNLRSLAQRGQSAADSQAGIQSQAGRDLAQMEMQVGQAELGARQNAGSQLGQMEYGAGQSGQNAALQSAQQMAQLSQQTGMNQAQLQQALGQNLSNIYGSTGSNLASLRYGAGQDVANQLGMTGQQLAQLQSGQGSALAGIDQQTAANIANLSAQQGQQTSGLRTDLATILANLATGSGSQQSNLALQMGNAQAGGVTNPWGNTASSISGLIASNPQLISNMLPAYNQQTTTQPAYNDAPVIPQ
ncbi:MAG: hypothetical protein GY900_13480 [Actinomycetia bacterium]|nr:hypothetical protein [Actinomycetes bacterium]